MSDDFRPVDPEGPLFPMQDGIGAQGYPNVSPFDIRRNVETEPSPALQPPPLPERVSRADLEEQARVMLQMLKTLTGFPWARERIHAFLEEGNRQYFRAVHLPPWPESPINATPAGGVSALTAIGAATTVDLVTIAVPIGSYGFARWLGQDTQNDSAGAGGSDWANLEWSLGLLQGANFVALPNYRAFTAQLGQIEAPCAINMFIPGGYSGVLRVRNTSGLAIPNVRGRLHGWYWPVPVRTQSIDVNGHMVG